MPRHLRTIALAVLLGCGSTAPDIGRSPDLDVLFIGNSLTATNDIPGLVSALGQISGGPQVRVSEVSFGNYSLEDHWSQGDALEAIDQGGWDYVIMQQGPSTLPESRQNLIEWATRFAELIPAGEAFRSINRDHPRITIFQSDNFHPTQIGSYLAALVIYGQLTAREVAGVTLRRPVTGLSPSDAETLEAAADQPNRDYGIH